MSRRKTISKREDEKWLNFADLFDVLDNNLSKSITLIDSRGSKVAVKNTNPAIIALIAGVGGKHVVDDLLQADGDRKKDLSSTASGYISYDLAKRKYLPQEVVDIYHNPEDDEYVYSYVKNEIYSQMTNTEQLRKELKNLINNTPDFPQKEEMIKQNDDARLLAECLGVATSYKVKVIETKMRINEEIREEQEKSHDTIEQEKNNTKSPTHAVSIILEGEELKYSPFDIADGRLEFHDFESLLDYIM